VGLDVELSGRDVKEKLADMYFDGVNIPLKTESVDAVLCTEVLEHAIDPELLIGEIFRILRRGGRVCVTVPFIWGLHELPYDFRRFTPFGLAGLVSKRGFVIDHQERLSVGAPAIRMLIDSEVNNFLVNVMPTQKMSRIGAQWFRFKVLLHERLLRVLDRIWHSTFRFERVYIDNLLIAHRD
jgi:SAM-dependent methyltransferase